MIGYGVGLLVLLILVFFIGGALADGIRALFGIETQEDTPAPPPDVPIPSLEGGPQIRALARRLHTDMDGISVPGGRDTEAWNMVLELDAVDFIALNNDFNNLYFHEGHGTFRQWIEDENFWYTTSINTIYGIITGTQLKNDLLERMDNLNIS